VAAAGYLNVRCCGKHWIPPKYLHTPAGSADFMARRVCTVELKLAAHESGLLTGDHHGFWMGEYETVGQSTAFLEFRNP